MPIRNNNLATTTQKSQGGRNLGSRNKFTKEAKQELFDALKVDLENIGKALPVEAGERIVHLKHFAKMLTTGNDEVALEVRNILYEQLLPHFRKIGFYLPHVDQNKKVSELRQFLKMLSPEMIEEIVKDMSQRQKIRFTN